MKPEIHLMVLWENARKAEDRILADIPKHVEIVAKLELAWPGDAATGYQEFYGTYLPDPVRKVREAGAGKFLVLVVKDMKPRYAHRRTERGMELLDERIYQMKRRYREWIGGSHIVHATNSVEEAKHDLWLLTSIGYDDWESGAWKSKTPRVISGREGWPSLRAAFETLDRTVPYAVLRGYDHLPDDYVRERDTDIDMLVEDCRNAAWILHAKKVYPHLPWRPHYEISVAGEPVRLDLRSIGDGYYCEAWERDMLRRRTRCERGFFVLGAEDGFPSLVYHAILQKKMATPNLGKVFVAAKVAGVPPTVAGALEHLDRFMAERGYRMSKPSDRTVYFNMSLARRADLAAEVRDLLGVRDLRPENPPFEIPEYFETLPKIRFSGAMDGRDARVEYSPVRSDTFDTEFRSMQAFALSCPGHALRPATWRMVPSGAFLVGEPLPPGKSLAEILSSGEATPGLSDSLAAAFLEIAAGLDAAGVVHRDIQPRNIWVADDGRILLAGFDMAVVRKMYRKEKKFVRRHFRAMLERLGGKFVHFNGVWSDAASFAKILEVLPRTGATGSAIANLHAMSRPLAVRAPAKECVRLFFRIFKRGGKNAHRGAFAHAAVFGRERK